MLRVTAHENGVTRLIGHVLPENTAGRRLVAGAGGTETGRTASGLLTTEICNDDSRPVLSSNTYRRAGTAARGEGGVPPVDGDGR